ncbi:DUF484 family protein [Advenella sp. RU8]|uniref:DUF484 family protein n=1 Tax=Advenella sp. RU8 TaxID=3399575 RepID=UPI003AADF1B7
MSETKLEADEVAIFLKNNPSFFEDHAQLFASLSIPHPYADRTLSLGARQVMTLRKRSKALEWKLAELMQNADSNASISDSMTLWCTQMLAEKNKQKLPATIIESLKQAFEQLDVSLRLWDLPMLRTKKFKLDEDPALHAYASSLEKPYCGPEGYLPAHEWLEEKPASVAMLPLKTENRTFGLLVFGAASEEHFTPDMGTVFLENLGKLASASLSRLIA